MNYNITRHLSAASMLFILIVSLIGSMPRTASAASKNNEIHYQSIESVRGGQVIVADHSPQGDTRYSCNSTSGKCKKIKSSTAVKPKIQGNSNYTASSQGKYGVRQKEASVNNQYGTTFTLYDISASKAKSIGSFSVVGTVLKQTFSPDESTFVVVAQSGVVTSFDIDTKKTRVITIAQTELPFYNVSYAGSYISTYNYLGSMHRVWNTKTGQMMEFSGTPSYVEFSASEDEAAFLVDNNGFKNLSRGTGFEDGSVRVTSVASGRYLVEDYLYVGEKLYYLSNRESPLAWNIYTPENTNPIATNASYGDFLKRVDGKLAYLKIEGKNSNVYLYDESEDVHTLLRAAPQTSAASNITRSEITIAGRSAALLSPKKSTRSTKEQSRNVFIWLHGGPMRQTSVGYHPYLSYAVYDELLEKLASGGNYVLKLDYAGSWGYGQEFLDKLNGQVGVVEINDVKSAIAEFKKKYAVDNVYLIGNSYGGYMAFRSMNEMPNEIDGIISINGVSDWYELITNIPTSPFTKVFFGTPNPQNMALYQKASVFTNANAIDAKTPLLVFYGTKDNMVPTVQSIQYETVMRNAQKNVTLVAFPDEEHVLRKRSTLTTLCKTITEELSLKSVSCKK